MTARTRHALTLALLTTLVALVGCLLFVKGSRAQEPTETLCWRHPDGVWPVSLYVAGLPLTAAPRTVSEGDEGVVRCVDVPGLVRPFSLRVVAHGSEQDVEAVLEDGSPGPLVVYRSLACRMDADGSGRVGGMDFLSYSRVFGATCP